MRYPNFNEEKKLWKQGYATVIGLDEVGRGPLAGPVVVGAVVLTPTLIRSDLMKVGVNDSKKLSEKQRERLYKIFIKHPDIKWGIGIVSEKIIDRLNILEATKLAMQRSLNNLYRKNCSYNFCGISCFLLIDGNFSINTKKIHFCQGYSEPKQKSIIKGDQKILSISIASIIAKVTRDRMMQKIHKKYPQYGFDKHKGYGTSLHIKNLKKFGLCNIHRKSFEPVKSFTNIN